MSEDVISVSDLPVVASTGPREVGKTVGQVEQKGEDMGGPGSVGESNPAQVIDTNKLAQKGTFEEQIGAKRMFEDRQTVPGVPNPTEASNPAQIIDLNELAKSDDLEVRTKAQELLPLRGGK